MHLRHGIVLGALFNCGGIMVDWTTRPTLIEYWPEGVEYILGLDENGTSNTKGIKKKLKNGKTIPLNEKEFTLTGVVLNKDNYSELIKNINEIKYDYWDQGLYKYGDTKKRVCFHSSEIRKRDAPFNLENPLYRYFMDDLTTVIASTRTAILSCSIDMEKHCRRYSDPYHPYHLAIEFILERYCGRLNHHRKNGIIILESRGRKEDKFVLKHIVKIKNEGTFYKSSSHFRHLEGAYFNPKWSVAQESKASFVILELADLISYPIHKFARSGYATKDLAFESIEKKLLNYPHYMGSGLKKFP